MDMADFFPSISEALVIRLLTRGAELGYWAGDPECARVVARLACCARKGVGELSLSIGAPSSPAVSNALFFDSDNAIQQICQSMGVIYSRYADDMYFSTRAVNVLSSVEQRVRETLRFTPNFRVNDEKTIRTSSKHRVSVTGLVVTPEHKVSVGRALKRGVRTRLFLALAGRLEASEFASLRGTIAYIHGVEPSFVESLVEKFGRAEFDRFMSATE